MRVLGAVTVASVLAVVIVIVVGSPLVGRVGGDSALHSRSSRGASANFSDRSSVDPDDRGLASLSGRPPLANRLRTKR